MSRGRVLVATVTLLLVYVGSYVGLCNPARYRLGSWGGYTSWVEPDYRVGGDAAERVFWPLEMLDRRVRPDFWATRSDDCDLDAVGDPSPPSD